MSFGHLGILFYNSFRVLRSEFELHIESRSRMTSSIFFRRLSTCLSMTTAFTLILAFSLFFFSPSLPWSSWKSVHSHLSEVKIVTSADEIKVIQFTWWAVFALSALYVVLSFVLGEEARDAFKSVVEHFKKKREAPHVRKLILPLL